MGYFSAERFALFSAFIWVAPARACLEYPKATPTKIFKTWEWPSEAAANKRCSRQVTTLKQSPPPSLAMKWILAAAASSRANTVYVLTLTHKCLDFSSWKRMCESFDASWRLDELQLHEAMHLCLHCFPLFICGQSSPKHPVLSRLCTFLRL